MYRKSPQRIRAVAVIISNEQVVIMHRKDEGKEYYVFPGGGVEDGETVKEAVLREVAEETSLDVSIEQLLYTHNYDNGDEQYFYLCTYNTGELYLNEGTETEEMRNKPGSLHEPLWMPISQLPHLLLYPIEIRDWFIHDLKNGFKDTPRQENISISELRKS